MHLTAFRSMPWTIAAETLWAWSALSRRLNRKNIQEHSKNNQETFKNISRIIQDIQELIQDIQEKIPRQKKSEVLGQEEGPALSSGCDSGNRQFEYSNGHEIQNGNVACSRYTLCLLH